MRHVIAVVVGSMLIALSSLADAQDNAGASTNLAPAPKSVSMAQLKDMASMNGQLVQVNSAVVRHTDTAQAFTVGDGKGPEIHVMVPSPAVDGPRAGDAVAVTGYIRRFDRSSFEKDYRWFRQADYPDIHAGDWLIVATSVQTAEGTQLVPGNTISNLPPNAPKTVPREGR